MAGFCGKLHGWEIIISPPSCPVFPFLLQVTFYLGKEEQKNLRSRSEDLFMETIKTQRHKERLRDPFLRRYPSASPRPHVPSPSACAPHLTRCSSPSSCSAASPAWRASTSPCPRCPKTARANPSTSRAPPSRQAWPSSPRWRGASARDP